MFESPVLFQDIRTLDAIVGSSSELKDRLRQAEERPLEPASIDALVQAGAQIQEARRIADNYYSLSYDSGLDAEHDVAKRIQRDELKRMGMLLPGIHPLEYVLYTAVGAFVGAAARDFYRWLKKLLSASSPEDKKAYRKRLNSAAANYAMVCDSLNMHEEPRCRNILHEPILHYAAMLSSVSGLEGQYQRLDAQLPAQVTDNEYLIDLQHRMQSLHDSYEAAVAKHKPRERLAKRHLRDMPKEIRKIMKATRKQHGHYDFDERLGELKANVSDIGRRMQTAKKETEQAEHWNSQYPISDKVIYVAREDSKQYDVREFIYPDDAILKDVVEREALRGSTLDDIAEGCMRWVQKHITYETDEEQFGYLEEWQFPTDTLQNGRGDCEDGTNLMISLMRNAGMPAYRIKNACGEVAMPAGIGGHSWPLYLREKDDTWVILDWSYKPTNIAVGKREPARLRYDYTKIYFTFNDEHSWAQHDMEVRNDMFRPKPGTSHVEPALREQQTVQRASVPAGNGRVVILRDELDSLGRPNDSRLYQLYDVLAVRHGTHSWLETMQALERTVQDLEQVPNLQKSAYPLQVHEKLQKFYDHGYLADIARMKESHRGRIEHAMGRLHSFAQRAAGS